MYDCAHGQSDYIEQISHSLFSLEFENHRPLYDWYLDQVYDETKVRNKQREFARMNVSYMITSKRKLQRLVAEKVVTGWDDPRMPTISAVSYTHLDVYKRQLIPSTVLPSWRNGRCSAS